MADSARYQARCRRSLRVPSIRRRALATLAADGARVPVDLAAHLALATASQQLAMWDTLASEDTPLRQIEWPEEIDVPVLLLWGDRDRIASRAAMDRYQQRLPRARLVELPGLCHSPQLDAPERVAHEILAFTNTAVPT